MSPTKLQKQRPLWYFMVAQHIVVSKVWKKPCSYLKLTPTLWSRYSHWLPKARQRLLKPQEVQLPSGLPNPLAFPRGQLCLLRVFLLQLLTAAIIQITIHFTIYYLLTLYTNRRLLLGFCKSKWKNLYSRRKFTTSTTVWFSTKPFHWLEQAFQNV